MTDAPPTGPAVARLTRRLAPLGRALPALAVADLVANVGIVLTGGAVRLTASGLGCPTWPRCTEDSYVTHGELGFHGVIEFGNRMLTFVLAAVAVATLLAALGAAHRRASWLALGIGLGIPAQAVIGGVTVLTGLNPWVVSLHFLVSMLIVSLCVWLVAEVRRVPRPAATPGVSRLTWLVLALGWVVLYLGTVVTGSGPHAGDLDARRTGLDPALVSQVHAVAVYALVGMTVVALVAAHRTGHALLTRRLAVLLALELAQGVVGWTQYALDLPVLLVWIHLLGASLVAAGLASCVLASRPPADPRPRVRAAARAPSPEGTQPVSNGSSATATNSNDR